MHKLLAAYRDERSLQNAKKLRAYVRKHPMARCLLTPADNDTLSEAISNAELAEQIDRAMAITGGING